MGRKKKLSERMNRNPTEAEKQAQAERQAEEQRRPGARSRPLKPSGLDIKEAAILLSACRFAAYELENGEALPGYLRYALEKYWSKQQSPCIDKAVIVNWLDQATEQGYSRAAETKKTTVWEIVAKWLKEAGVKNKLGRDYTVQAVKDIDYKS